MSRRDLLAFNTPQKKTDAGDTVSVVRSISVLLRYVHQNFVNALKNRMCADDKKTLTLYLVHNIGTRSRKRFDPVRRVCHTS